MTTASSGAFLGIHSQMLPNKHVDRITDLKNKMYLFDQKTRMGLAGNFTEENLKRFEKANGLKINIYLIGENKGEVDPYYLSDNEEGTPLHLGLISKKDRSGIKSHYILIKDLANVVKPDSERGEHKFYVCNGVSSCLKGKKH
jgi:hypothetical protein